MVASNLANADTVAGPDGSAYKARQVVFQTGWLPARGPRDGAAGVRVSTIAERRSPGRRVHDPRHPGADAEGYVTYSNVNPVEEMVNMISASRSYQNNVEVMNTARSLLLKTLQIGQCMSMHASDALSRLDVGAAGDGPHRRRNDAGSADRFLKLLVAQMQSQDPLNPMDNAQVTSQMAQINTVNGIDAAQRHGRRG